MIKVNIKLLIATRSSIPTALIGLTAETLRNLQTELNPVPSEFKDIEFWDEVDVTPAFDASTHVLDGTETLTAVKASKTVEVLKGIRAKTAEELAAFAQQRASEVEREIQIYIDQTARLKGYGDANTSPSISCRAYAGYPNVFQDEAIAYGQWVSNCWATSFVIMAEVEAGTRPIPTAEEVIANLPEMIWPTGAAL